MEPLIPFAPHLIGSTTLDTVNARDIHQFLESKAQYSHWIARRIARYEFLQDIDYCVDHSGYGPMKTIEYYVTFSMAKELSMVENTTKGREARRYFIDCEERAKALAATPTLPALHDPIHQAIIDIVKIVDTTRHDVAQLREEFNAHVAQGARTTLRHYYYTRGCEREMTGALSSAFRKVVNRLCDIRHIPVRSAATRGQWGADPNEYPLALIEELFPAWWARRVPQLTMDAPASQSRKRGGR